MTKKINRLINILFLHAEESILIARALDPEGDSARHMINNFSFLGSLIPLSARWSRSAPQSV